MTARPSAVLLAAALATGCSPPGKDLTPAGSTVPTDPGATTPGDTDPSDTDATGTATPATGDTGAAGDTGTPPASAPEVCTDGGWCWEYPLPQGNFVYGLYAAAPDRVWATDLMGQVLHFDGIGWSVVARTGGVAWVHGSAADDVWVVGGDEALHFDGAAWTAYAVPESILRGLWVASPTEAWIAGSGGEVRRWDGAAWIEVPTDTTALLTGVWRAPSGEIWVTGWNGTLLRGDATGLTSVANPYTGTSTGLNAVWGSADDDVWFATSHSLALRWDGRAFTTSATGVFHLDTLWGTGPDDVYGAGSDELVHYDGASWSVAVDPSPDAWIGTYAVHGSAADDVWVGGAGGLLARYDGLQWDSLSSPLLLAEPGPRALWGTSAEDLWAAGGGGVLYHRQATGWSAIRGPTEADLRGLWGAAPDDVWAVGERALLHHDGVAWTDRTADLPGAAPTLNGIWGAGGTVIAVGDHGRIVCSAGGGAWQDEGIDVLDLNAVWGAAPDDVWAVGDLNAIYHHDGASWTRVPHPRDGQGAASLWAVRGSAADDVWAVGEVSLPDQPAVLLHWDGVAWTDRSADLPADVGHNLHALWVDGAELWVGGHYYGANTAHFDGTTWTAHETRAETVTMALWGDADAVFSAGGDYGLHLMRWDR